MIKFTRHTLATGLLCGAMLATLSGCFPLLVGGAVTGGLAAADRRTLGAQTEDQSIGVKAELKLPGLVGDAGHVNVNSFNRRVLLTGEVRDQAMKDTVARDIGAIEGVQGVIDELEISGPASYTSRSSDVLITTKVKASLVDMKEISASSFKVVTERGTVYMMGRVTPREGTIGADVARGVSGVQKVVKIFEYITDEELKQYQSQPQTAKSQDTANN